jgi:hypothetical protein
MEQAAGMAQRVVSSYFIRKSEGTDENTAIKWSIESQVCWSTLD